MLLSFNSNSSKLSLPHETVEIIQKPNVSNNRYELEIVENDDFIDFEDFNNTNGLDYDIIPNIVHLLYLNQPYLRFFEMVNIFSIFFNHKPDKIYFHCDNCSFSGKYFNVIRNYPDLWNIISIHKIPFHKTIFRKKYG